MPRRVYVFALSILALLVSMSAIDAQTDAPVIFHTDGDIWVWEIGTGATRQLTTWRHNGRPVLAPNGRQVAYDSLATMVVEAIARQGGIGGGGFPTNIWVLDVVTGDAFRVADQPPDASFVVSGTPDKGIVRSQPVWSPDGSQLAWVEFDIPFENDQSQRLVAYSFATSSTRVVNVSVPMSVGVPSASRVIWGRSGLIVRVEAFREGTSTTETSFWIFDPTSGAVTATPALPSDGGFVVSYTPVDNNGREFLALAYDDGTLSLLDPLSGALQPLPGTLELYSPANPANSVTARIENGVVGFYDSAGTQLTQSVDMPEWALFDQVSIAPDGQGVAYVPFSGNNSAPSLLLAWRDGRVSQVPTTVSVSGITWGASSWRVTGAGFVAPGGCATALAPRLTAGGRGYVLPGEPNNVRNQPTTNAARLGQVPAGGLFDVVTGPICADGILWWQVRFEGVTGWTAESLGSDYYLAPLP